MARFQEVCPLDGKQQQTGKKKGLALESRHVDFLVRALASQLVCSQRRSAGGDLGE